MSVKPSTLLWIKGFEEEVYYIANHLLIEEVEAGAYAVQWYDILNDAYIRTAAEKIVKKDDSLLLSVNKKIIFSIERLNLQIYREVVKKIIHFPDFSSEVELNAFFKHFNAYTPTEGEPKEASVPFDDILGKIDSFEPEISDRQDSPNKNTIIWPLKP